jgi:hypothetical protein
MLVIILLVVAGCVKNKGAPVFPIHARPHIPRAIIEPHEVFLRCDDNPDSVESLYYCIEAIDLEQLRIYTIGMDSLVRKYENATKELNGR